MTTKTETERGPRVILTAFAVVTALVVVVVLETASIARGPTSVSGPASLPRALRRHERATTTMGERERATKTTTTTTTTGERERSNAIAASTRRAGDECVHGYRSATKRECVCRHGFGGSRCEQDLIPSCNRTELGSCMYVYSTFGTFIPYQTCACVKECENVLRDELQPSDDEWRRMTRERAGKHNTICKDERGESLDWTTWEKADVIGEMTPDFGHARNVCTHGCFGKGECVDRVCSCDGGRFGLLCQFSEADLKQAARNSSKKSTGKRELRVEYYDELTSHVRVPLFTEAYHVDVHAEKIDEHGANHTTERVQGGNYATTRHIAETILQEKWKGTLLTPFHATHRMIPFFPVSLVGNVGYALNFLSFVVRQLPNNDDLDDPWYVFFSMQDRGYCAVVGARDLLPNRSVVIHSFGWQNFESGQDPRISAKCSRPGRDIVVPAHRHANFYRFHEKDFDPSTKTDGPLLFFSGSTRPKNNPKCVGDALLDNALSCMNEYSQAVRKYVVDKFANASDFHINKPSQGSEGYSRDVMKTAKYCLVAGGHGFDMRLADSIVRGCVPLLTAVQMSYPYEGVLDYSKFSVLIRDDREPLRDLPKTLRDEFAKGEHANMVRRLRYVHEAFVMQDDLTDEAYRERHDNNVTDAGISTLLSNLALVTDTALPNVVRETMCRLAFQFLDGRGHEIFTADALTLFACADAKG